MTDAEILSEMIREEALRPVSAQRSVELREEQADDSKVTISQIPTDAVIINADMFTAPTSIFKNSRHECKRADYVIISEEKKRIVYIEMKQSRASSGEEVFLQLLGAKCFIAYCREIGRGFWGYEDFLKDYQERFILFSHTSTEKRRTRLSRVYASPQNSIPKKYLTMPGQKHVQFDEIAG